MESLYSDSSSESEGSEGFEDVVQQVVAKGDITGASWYAERTSEDLPTNEQQKDPVKMTARAYQLEMFDASLKENIICAMDTGSGKTQVYGARLLPACPPVPII